jgi:hypothetical protein
MGNRKAKAKANYRRTVLRFFDCRHVPQVPPRLPVRHRAVYRLVLLGTPLGVQWHRGGSLPNSS